MEYIFRMNKRQEKILRETIRETLLHEGKFTDWVADRVGIPRGVSLDDMSPTGRHKNMLKQLDFPTMQNNFKGMYDAFRAARGHGRQDPAVRTEIEYIKNVITRQLARFSIDPHIAMRCAVEFIGSAEKRAHEDMHRYDAQMQNRDDWRVRLGLKESAAPRGGEWAAYITPNRLTAVLYHGGIFQESLDSWRARKGDAPFIKTSGFYQAKVTAGVIQLVHPQNPCHGALEIAYVAGPGKPLTSLGYYMSPTGRLIMDRRPGKVSGDAVRSWVGAFGKGGNLPLDNVQDPQTQPIEDDCDFQDLPDPLNYAYEGDQSIGRAAQERHNQIMAQLSTEERAALISGLEGGAEAFWDATYKG